MLNGLYLEYFVRQISLIQLMIGRIVSDFLERADILDIKQIMQLCLQVIQRLSMSVYGHNMM